MIKVDNLAPCIIFSIIIHSLVFGTIYYKNNKKNVFVQVPFEVSFYSPVQQTAMKEVVEENKVEPKVVPPAEKPKEQVKEKKKSDIVIKKKEKEVEKKVTKKEEKETKPKEEKVEEKPADKPAEGTGAPKDGNGSSYPSRGIFLENKNFKFGYYTNNIVKKISRHWQWSANAEPYRAVVYFKIYRDGRVFDVKIKESSGDSAFDQNAIRAVELSSPFAPLPDSYNEDSLGVYFEFKFN
ncbi:MAG: TonB family protein [Elusimicrobia bacterium]|nr:TonB family protein [Elusimicrobiota bacterium]